MIFAGVLAGGKGTRLESSIPKQFIEIEGIPLIVRTLKTFLSVESFNKVIVSMNKDWVDYCLNLFSEYDMPMDRLEVILGGETRFESLYNVTLKAAKLSGGKDDIIVTHDCARLFVSKRILEDNIRDIENYDAVTTAIPTIDTILHTPDGKVSTDVPVRKELWLDQGPQSYKVAQFLEMADKLTSMEREKYMEAGKLYIDSGLKVGLVMGDRYNFKITNDIDLKYAAFLLREGAVQ
ncbi:MAG: D-ribitol-5-phosphate cytidylyltransferase [Bacillota bacterium]|nr:D-ribitol-5-phosphate cytidylyltransferase [Bacillota bacterium]